MVETTTTKLKQILSDDMISETSAIEVLAKKCIQDHRGPIVKVILPTYKLFFAAKNNEERALIEEHQNQFRSILEHQRVEKRSSRAQAIWFGDEGIAKVTKIVKNLVKYFGYQNKDGVFLYPEEMLYLMETNRLEVTFEDKSLSIEKAYDVVLNTSDMTLTKYRTYKKLAILGYKLIRFEQLQSRSSHREKKIDTKRLLEDLDSCDLPDAKKLKHSYSTEIRENESEADTFNPSISRHGESAAYISNIFDQLRLNTPKSCANALKCTKPDYCIWSPTNTSKVKPDYNLFICERNITAEKNFNSNIPDLYAICIDDVSFYRFSDIHLPCV